MTAQTQIAEDTDSSASASVGEQNSHGIPATKTQEPLHDQPESAADVQTAETLPFLSIEQRQYSVEWDPRRYVAFR